MSRWLVYSGLAVFAVVFAGSVLTWRFLSAAGYFTEVQTEVAADCHEIRSVPGPEDIVVDRQRGVAFVSAYDRRAVMAGGEGSDAVRGGIYLIDLKGPRKDWGLSPVTPREPESFRPHGISLYEDAAGTRRLFVVNHPANAASEILIYDIGDDNQLTLAQTVRSSLIVSPNDVVAVGPDSFYATNDHGTSSPTGKMVDDFLLLRNGNVVYYDGSEMRVAADTLGYPNGINVSPDGSRIYVATTMEAALHVYKREPQSGALEAFDFARLGTGTDNIDVLPDGTLLIGSHPDLVMFMEHAGDPKALSPGQVVRVEPAREGGGKAGTIYLNKGEQISGLSVAAGYKDQMLIGAVFEPKILACKQSTEIKSY